MTNKELNIYIEKYKQGDQEAFSIIYKETYQSVYYTIYLLTKNNMLIDDFVQDTYLKVIDKIDSYQLGTNFHAWISKIARNIAINHYNKTKDDLIFFGDAENDIPMLDIAGYPVVMGQAKEELKQRLSDSIEMRMIAQM